MENQKCLRCAAGFESGTCEVLEPKSVEDMGDFCSTYPQWCQEYTYNTETGGFVFEDATHNLELAPWQDTSTVGWRWTKTVKDGASSTISWYTQDEDQSWRNLLWDRKFEGAASFVRFTCLQHGPCEACADGTAKTTNGTAACEAGA
jgi:hypothetical protein